MHKVLMTGGGANPGDEGRRGSRGQWDILEIK